MTKESEATPNTTLRLEGNVLARADAIRDRLAAPPLRLEMTRAGVLKSAVLSGLDSLEGQHLGVVRDLSDPERVALEATVGLVVTIVKGEPHPLSDEADADMRGRIAEALLSYRRTMLTGRADG